MKKGKLVLASGLGLSALIIGGLINFGLFDKGSKEAISPRISNFTENNDIHTEQQTSGLRLETFSDTPTLNTDDVANTFKAHTVITEEQAYVVAPTLGNQNENVKHSAQTNNVVVEQSPKGNAQIAPIAPPAKSNQNLAAAGADPSVPETVVVSAEKKMKFSNIESVEKQSKGNKITISIPKRTSQ